MRTPAVIRFNGPEPYIDPVEGTETPEWYVFAADALGDPTLADAILDRLVHHAHALALAGESLRKLKPKLTKEPLPE